VIGFRLRVKEKKLSLIPHNLFRSAKPSELKSEMEDLRIQQMRTATQTPSTEPASICLQNFLIQISKALRAKIRDGRPENSTKKCTQQPKYL
jgi:hypothetical protein